jgi:hypothetical protein
VYVKGNDAGLCILGGPNSEIMALSSPSSWLYQLHTYDVRMMY